MLMRREGGTATVAGSAVMGRMMGYSLLIGWMEMLRGRDLQWWQSRSSALVSGTSLVVVISSSVGRGGGALLKEPLTRRGTLDTCDRRLDLEAGQ